MAGAGEGRGLRGRGLDLEPEAKTGPRESGPGGREVGADRSESRRAVRRAEGVEADDEGVVDDLEVA